MKSILIQQSHNKFLQNCSALSFEDITIVDIAIGNNLYQTFFKYKPEHCLFSADTIDKEVAQFCEDYHDQTNIYFFCQNEELSNRVKSIIGNNLKIQYIGYYHSDNIIIPESLINDQLFFNTNTNTKDSVVCFMDGLSIIPSQLQDILYPNTKIPIKIFNCPQIKHYQNLGTLTEQDRASVLQTHRYYLDLQQPMLSNYINEAIACGCIPISIEDIKNNTYTTKLLPKQNSQPETYSHFLRNALQL